MPRIVKPKTQGEVDLLVEQGFYAVGGVPGLHLQVRTPEQRSWVLRKLHKGKRTDFGLGSAHAISLDVARIKARDMLQQIHLGIEREKTRSHKPQKKPWMLLMEKRPDEVGDAISDRIFRVAEPEIRAALREAMQEVFKELSGS